MSRRFLGLCAVLCWLGVAPAVAVAIDPVNRGAVTRIIVEPACKDGSATAEQPGRCPPSSALPSLSDTYGNVLLKVLVCLIPLIVGFAFSLLAQKRSGLARLSRPPIVIGLTGSVLAAIVFVASWQAR